MIFKASPLLAALQQNTSSGLSWLIQNKFSNEYWGRTIPADTVIDELTRDDISPVAFRDSSQAATALAIYDPNSLDYQNVLAWLQSTNVKTTEDLSRKISVLAVAESDVSVDLGTLLTYQNKNGGFGGYKSTPSNPLDTALALQALKAVSYADSTLIGQSLSYLIINQNTDGGWGFTSGDSSNVYMTAVVSATLQQFPQTTGLATAISKATSYLVAHQNPDGGFGSSPSTVYETALAYKALANVITDSTVLGNAVNYLIVNQASDGSWSEDPYSTALALQALYIFDHKPTPPPPPPTTGTASGTVIDASTNQPLNGVAVNLVNNAAVSTLTNSTGSFSLANIPQGSQQISFSLNGYAASTAAVTMTAGSIVNIGSVPLSVVSTTGIIQGTITDASTGSPLSGAIITVTGTTTWTGTTSTNGFYKITGIAPGDVTISASNSGYSTVSSAGTVTAGGTLVFSPSLTVVNTKGGLKGKIVDSTAGLPLAGASVALTGTKSYTASTDSSGNFALSAMDAGSYSGSVSLAGYGTQTFFLTIIAGTTTDLGSVPLTANPTTGTVQGMIKDVSTSTAIAGTTITVSGTSTWTAVTITDGSYKITGIAPGTISVSASKTGYSTVSGTGTVTAGGTLTFSPSLSTTPPTETTGVLKGTVTNNTGQPISGATISITGRKAYATTTGIAGSFSVSTMDPDTYTVSVSAVGYLPQSYTVTVLAGVTTDIGSLNLLSAPTTGSIGGMVTDAATGSVLEGVLITATGATTTQAFTATDGTYQLSNAAPGAVTLSAEKTGFGTVTGTGNVTAGGRLTFSPGLQKLPTTGDVKGTVINSSTGQPVPGATITVTPNPGGTVTNAVSNAAGVFTISGISPASYTVSIAASNYRMQAYSVTIIAGVVTDLGVINLSPMPTSTTITGTVKDASTGSPIANANVSIMGTSLKAVTASDGTYSLSNITTLDFSVQATATGYDGNTQSGSSTVYGMYTVDISLSPHHAISASILSVTPDKGSYSAYSNAVIAASVENSGDAAANVLIYAQIKDSAGNVMSIVGPSNPQVTIASHATTAVTMVWNTAQSAPGTYQIVVRATDPITASDGNYFGNLLSEESASVTIQSSVVVNGVINVVPGFTYIGATDPVNIDLTLTSQSNIPADLTLEYTVKSPSGALVGSGSTPASLSLDTTSTSLSLTTLNNTFTESGAYPIYVAVYKDGQMLKEANAVLTVLSNIRIAPSKTVSPGVLPPTGTGKVTVTIDLKAVEK